MNERQALTKARKLLGDKAAVRWNPSAQDADEKAAALVRFREARTIKDKLIAERDILREQLLSDPRYVALHVKCHQARVAADAARPSSSSRAVIGRTTNLFFVIEAEGDTFGEAFAKIEAKRKGGAP